MEKFKRRFMSRNAIVGYVVASLGIVWNILRWLIEQYAGDRAVRLIDRSIEGMPDSIYKSIWWIQDNPALFAFCVLIVLVLIILTRDLVRDGKYVPEKLYIEEKAKSDRFNWNGVGVSAEPVLGGMGDKEHKEYRIKIENKKAETCYFSVELSYLEIDDRREDYHEKDKLRHLLWISNDDSNRTFGVALKTRDVGYWGLFEVTGNANNKKYRISYCGYKKSEAKKPSTQYVYFSRFAKGEIRFLGKFVSSTGLSRLDREWHEQNIPGDFIYRFEINVVDGNPTMVIFAEGPFHHHV